MEAAGALAVLGPQAPSVLGRTVLIEWRPLLSVPSTPAGTLTLTHTPRQTEDYLTCFPPMSGSRPRLLSKTSYSSLPLKLSSYNRRESLRARNDTLRRTGPLDGESPLGGGGSHRKEQGLRSG